MSAELFWERPGIAPGLRAEGFTVVAPDRNTAPASWGLAAAAMSRRATVPCSVVAGSNGVSVAVRMAIDVPSTVDRLVLLWPATARDGRVDALAPESVRHLLAGETLRGATDDELTTISVPTVIVASEPPNLAHAGETAERLATLIRPASLLPIRFPESPRPGFPGRCRELLDAIVPALR